MFQDRSVTLTIMNKVESTIARKFSGERKSFGPLELILPTRPNACVAKTIVATRTGVERAVVANVTADQNAAAAFAGADRQFVALGPGGLFHGGDDVPGLGTAEPIAVAALIEARGSDIA